MSKMYKIDVKANTPITLTIPQCDCSERVEALESQFKALKAVVDKIRVNTLSCRIETLEGIISRLVVKSRLVLKQ